MEPDGFVDLLVEFASTLHVMRGKPATDAFRLEISMEAVGKVLEWPPELRRKVKTLLTVLTCPGK